MSDSRASAEPRSPRDRRRERERERRARARRRGRLRLAAVVVVAAGAVTAVVALGGSGPPAVPMMARTEISVRVAAAGTLPAAVQDAAVASLGGGSLLLLGGIDAAQHSTSEIVERTAGRSSVRARLPAIQHDAQAAVLDGQVYVFGGGDIASYAHILRFDPASGAVTVAGALPRAQSDVAVATIGGTAFVVGGFDGVSPLDTIVAWRPGSAPRVVARLPFAIRYAAVAAAGGRLIIAGGTSVDGASDEIWSYDPADRAVVQIGSLPDPVTHASAVTVGGRVYLIGGRGSVSGAQTAAIVEIDPRTALAAIVGSLPKPLSDAAVALDGGRIIVAGGQGSGGAVRATVLSLTPVVSQVEVRSVSSAVAKRRAFAALKARGFAQALHAHPSSIPAYEAAAVRPGLPGYLLIADRGNNRILVVNPQGTVVWRYPTAADVAAGRILHFNDDTFVEPGGRGLIANEEDYGDVVSVDIKTHRLSVLFGVPGVLGGGPTHLNYPDDAYAYPDGSFTVADAYNCRILFVAHHAIVRQYGTLRGLSPRSADQFRRGQRRHADARRRRPGQRDPGPVDRRDRRQRKPALVGSGADRLPLRPAAAARGPRAARRLLEPRSHHRHGSPRPGAVALRADPRTGRAQPSIARDRAPQRGHRGQRRLPPPGGRDRPPQRQDHLAVRSHRRVRHRRGIPEHPRRHGLRPGCSRRRDRLGGHRPPLRGRRARSG